MGYVLVPFPFTDLSTNKKRPALIISPKDYNSGPDVLVMFVTSKLNKNKRPGDYTIKSWKEAGLPKASMTRMKLATLDKTLILKKFAHLKPEDIYGVKECLKDFLDIETG
ncbi:MAG: type II toxin-antitoxin system PemK/MazF family toxin [Balneolaceae bacterium]